VALVIAGERSGVGKTTVTLALLAALCRRQQLQVQSFKVGPDYIDPMFHRHLTQRPCRTLDPILTSESYVQHCFTTHARTAEAVLIEGVMGLFDGIPHNSTVLHERFPDITRQPLAAADSVMVASTAHIARILGLPILLVVDCSRLSGSIAAIAHGYRSLCPDLQIAGLVLNRVASQRHLALLKAALASVAVPVLGTLWRDPRVQLPDRHLGLVPAAEVPELEVCLNRLQQLGETCFDWQRLQPLLTSEGQVSTHKRPQERQDQQAQDSEVQQLADLPVPSHSAKLCDQARAKPRVRIAIAQDLAFSFYYADNLEQLQQLGAELVEFSPLADLQLPEATCGLYLGGGFPEMFAAQLAANQALKRQIQQAILAGLPTYAECGGLMYLCEAIVDFEQTVHAMVGVLPGQTVMVKKLTLGYRRAITHADSPFLASGTTVWGHEFHRSQLVRSSSDVTPAMRPMKQLNPPLWVVQGLDLSTGPQWEGCCPNDLNLHASYLHLHWGAQAMIPERFVQGCHAYQTGDSRWQSGEETRT
jgi:cobyrinic acid a,c-diamide synthase